MFSLRPFAFLLLGAIVVANVRADEKPVFSDMHRFLFFATIEGAYEDGLTYEEADSILRQPAQSQFYEHFIYACPICGPVRDALQTYQSRPRLFGMKLPSFQEKEQTFGGGIPAGIHALVMSNSFAERLEGINQLVRRWVNRRIERERLSPAERTRLMADFKEGREQGMRTLESFVENGTVSKLAPGFAKGDECAVCNASLGMDVHVQGSH